MAIAATVDQQTAFGKATIIFDIIAVDLDIGVELEDGEIVHGAIVLRHAACSSSAQAIACAAELIESGEAELVVAGGVDALCNLTLSGFASLLAVSDQFRSPNQTHFMWSVAGVLNWTLYDGGQRYATEESDREEVELSRQQLTEAQRQARFEVQTFTCGLMGPGSAAKRGFCTAEAGELRGASGERGEPAGSHRSILHTQMRTRAC